MIAKLRHILGLQTAEEKLEEYTLLKGELSDINDRTDILAEDYVTKLNGFNDILKSESYGTEIKERVQKRYTHFLQEQKKEVISLVNRRHKIEKSITSILKDEKIKDAVNEFELLEKAKSNYRDGNISKNVYNDIIKAKKGKVHYSDNFVFWNGKLLLIQRATDDDGANKWGVPGGHVDAGESHEDAAVRELQEETGLVVDKVVLAGTYSNDDVMIEYYTSHIESDTEPQLILDTAEHQSYRWIDLYRDNIDEFEFPFNMKENIKKLLLPKEERPQDISKAVNMFIDGFISKEVLSDIVKAMSGVYENTPENRKLGRVGQKYGSKKENEGKVASDKENKESKDLSKNIKLDNENCEYYLRFSDHIEEDLKRGWSSWNFGEEGVKAKSASVIGDKLKEIKEEGEGSYYISGMDIQIDESTKIDVVSDTVTIKNGAEVSRIKQLYPDYWVLVDDFNAQGGLSAHALPDDKEDIDDMKSHIESRKGRYDGTGDGDVMRTDGAKVIYSKGNMHIIEIGDNEKNNIQKSLTSLFEQGLISEDVLEKARTGKYADTSENRRLKRVGQPYGTKKGEDTKETKEPLKQEETTNKEGKVIPIDQHARQSSETALQEAAKGGDEELRLAAKKELERREKEESVSDQPEKENVSADTEKKPGEEKSPVSEKGKDDYDTSIKELENKIRELRSADIDYSDEKAMEENTKQVQEAMKERQRLVSERDSLRKVGFEEYKKDFNDFTGNTTEAGERYREESENIKKYLSENKKQKHSLDEYKFESYAPIREVLSSGKLSGSYEIYTDDGSVDITEDAVKDMIKDISSFISENKIKDNLVLNRRVKGDEAIKFFNSLKKGEMYEDKSYSSTSLVELPHFGEYNIQILAKKGSSVANIDNLGEREYLIDKGAKFRVLEKGEESIIVELL